MSNDTFDVIVLGTGGVGSAALYHLAKSGKRVLGLDAHPIGHNQGSSHGESRAIRQAYFEHPDYVPLVLEAYRLWEQLEQDSQSELFARTGLLQIGPEGGEVLQGVFRSASMHNLSIEPLSHSQLQERFPQFHLPPDLVGAFETAGGFLHVERAVEAQIRLAIASGAAWKQRRVLNWREDDRIVVETNEGTLEAEQLVICTGPWAATVLNEPQASLQVLAKHMRWYAAEPCMHLEQGCPVFLFELPTGIFYGFPAIDGRTIKVAEHSGGVGYQGKPENFPRDTSHSEQQRIDGFVRECLIAASHVVDRDEVCFYTMSQDHHFWLGRLPGSSRVSLAAGLSGHGFKFTPVIGKALAEICTLGSTSLPIEFLDPSRFKLPPDA